MGISMQMSHIEALTLAAFPYVDEYRAFASGWNQHNLSNHLSEVEENGMALVRASLNTFMIVGSICLCVEMNLPESLTLENRNIVHAACAGALATTTTYCAYRIKKLASSIIETRTIFNDVFKASAAQEFA